MPAVRAGPTIALLIAAALAMAGCGAGDAPERATGVRTVQVVRVAFPEIQGLAQPSTFAITVRNAGEQAIANLVVTLTGLSERAKDGTQQPVWIVDGASGGEVAASGDTRDAGPLGAGDATTLRWRLIPALAGVHDVTYAVAAGVRDAPRAQLVDGGKPQGTLSARVTDAPAPARVIPAPSGGGGGDRVIRVSPAASG